MKGLKKLAFLMVAVLVIGSMPMSTSSVNAATLKIKNVTSNKRTLYVGSVYQIKTNNKSKNLTYKSSKTSVATVTEMGLITAKKAGKSVITVKNTSTKKSKKLTVTVKKAKGYTISLKSGTYTDTKTIKVTAKKGYTVYYTTNNKYAKSKKIKSKKSKTFTISKTTTIGVFVKKNSSKVTVKKMNKTKLTSVNCSNYKYTINKVEETTTSKQQETTTVKIPTPNVPEAETADTSGSNTTDWDDTDKTGDDTSTEWNKSDPVYVSFTDDGITTTNATGDVLSDTGVALKSKVLKITVPGTYVLSGTLTDGSIQVKSGEGEYKVILNGVNVTCTTTAPFYATKKATKLTMTLAAGTTNYLNGPETYTFAEGEDEPDSTLFVKKELVINGSGTLNVTDPNGDGIKCKDQLKIADGNITVKAGDDGITGKDVFAMCGGTVNVTSTGDGIKTNNQTDTSLGYIDVTGGKIIVNSTGDGIQADTTATFENADVNVTTTYNSVNDSFKGIKAGGTITSTDSLGAETTSLAGLVYIKNGTYTFNTVEDAIHSKKDISIAGGTIVANTYSDGIQAEYNMTISGNSTNVNVTTNKNSSYTFIDSYKGLKAGASSTTTTESEGTLLIQGGTITVDTTKAGVTSGSTKGDDAVHSDSKLVINGGTVTATQCYEGLESYEIYLEGGTTKVTSSDDGMNAAGGNDSSGNAGGNNNWGQQSTSTGTLYINGGTHTVEAEGDGLDSNGNIYMTGGTVYVYGPTSGGNGILDYGDNNCTFAKSGGVLIGAGTSDMAVYPTCTKGGVCTYSVSGTANLACKFNDGTNTYNFIPTKKYSLVIISTDNIQSGSNYTLTYNGSSTASATATSSGSGNSNSNRPGGRPW